MSHTNTRPSASGAFQRAVFAGFIGNGIFTVLLGPILPALKAQWSLTDSQAGFLFTAQFIGSVAGVAAYGLVGRRFGSRLPLALGYGMVGLGVALLGAPQLRLAQIGVFTGGMGYGLVTPTSNLAIAAGDPSKSAARLNLLNFMWGLGAVMCPTLVGFAEGLHALHTFLWILTAVLAGFAASFLVIAVPQTAARESEESGAEMSRKLAVTLAILMPLFFLYVGTESSFGGWAAELAHQMSGMTGSRAALVPSFFWATLLLGRALAPAILKVVSEKTLALAGLAMALVGSLLLLVAQATPVLAVAMAFAGAGCSTIFPILVAWLTKFTKESEAGWRSLPFGAASFGGAVIPWVVGMLSTRYGGLRAGFPLVTLAIVTMILLAITLHRRAERSTA